MAVYEPEHASSSLVRKSTSTTDEVPQAVLSTAGSLPVIRPPARIWMHPRTIFSAGHWTSEIDITQASGPLIAYCFMTGFMDAVSYTAMFVWCAFQTGNSVQLALALARLFALGPSGTSFLLSDQQALTSIAAFLGGAFVGRVGDRLGAKTRGWLVLGTFVQTLFAMAAAIAAWKSGQVSVAPSRSQAAWTNASTFVALGFMSASMGLQAIMGKRLNTDFATTVVLTSVWCELMAHPQLLYITKLIPSRDRSILAVFAVFVGAFVGRAIIDAADAPTALGAGTGIRLLITLWWVFVPGRAN